MGPIAILSSTNNDQTAAGQQQQQQGVAARLAAESGSEKAGEIILDALVHKIADMLQIPASEVDPSRPMYRYGVDSLVALEVRNWIMRELNTTLALFLLRRPGLTLPAQYGTANWAIREGLLGYVMFIVGAIV